MMYSVYAVKDEKVEFNSILSCSISVELAIHSFGSSLVNVDPVIGRIEDYSLYFLGYFNTKTGEFESCEPKYVISGLHAYEKAKQRLEIFKGVEDDVTNMETTSNSKD